VDDIAVNLKVAEGLLAPYNMKIDTCLSGAEAIELVKKNKYDLIFMDHMMPEMDGIEATAAIRKLEMRNEELGIKEKQIPIIALTANAVVGMREMFIANGFNDFLSKPVDVSKMDEILNRWIRREKREANRDSRLPTPDSQLPTIPHIDTAKGIAMLRGNLDTYKKVLTMFCKDADERLRKLQIMPEADTLPAFIIQVHSLKSVSASIGAQEVSSNAEELETAGKAEDMDFIREHLPGFTVQLAEQVKDIREVLSGYAG
jgi:CheY-like chemotaxis protein/HPt (histidine-containing phosphotransfer) domain-containing protein